jgi:hypothetical protein
MKRIILSAMVLAFAVAAQAGDTKSAQDTPKEMPSCCSSKVKVSTEAKEGTCPMAKGSCCMQSAAKQSAAKRVVLMSPKAMSLASK